VSTEHWFVDETKEGAYTLAVVSIAASDVWKCRAEMRKLPRSSTAALHFTKESDAKRAGAFRTIAAMPLTATIVRVPAGIRAVPARERAVRTVARLAVAEHPQRLIFELDEASAKNDRRWLREELAGRGIEYDLLGKKLDPLLWIADGIAWAVFKGGKWRAMIDHRIVRTIEA